jgi:CubicO group peptidase (beta-lactamase class C family)
MLLVMISSCAVKPAPIEMPLKLEVPVAEVISDLQRYIPLKMREAGVPGLSIALIRDGKLVWAQGFGVTNVLTGQPVTETTIFEAASIGKPITAYAALKLRDDGVIALDQPLQSYLRQPYLRPSQWASQITLRQVLSHTSGLSNSVIFGNTRIHFQPGSQFSYSGVGFEYLQKVMEQVTGLPFDDYMQQVVFNPLAMSSSSYEFKPEFESRAACRHFNLGVAIPEPWFWEPTPDAKNLVRSTPSDIARFMIELIQPQHVSSATIDEMTSEQVKVTEHVRWGLGIGLQPSSQGEAFWQWGDDPGFESLMVGYRAQRIGVVIMTNSSKGQQILREIAARAIGGSHYSYWDDVNMILVF